MRGRRLAAGVLKAGSLIVAAALMVGGDLSYSETTRERNAAASAGADRSGPSPSNTALRWLIQAKYRSDDLVGHSRIVVRADGGVVTLKGTVESDYARARAIALAEHVRGVRAVHDRLQVEDEGRFAE